MKIAITGTTGMLGRALQKAFAKHSLSPLSSCHADITSLQEVRRAFSELQPDWIIHTAAFTNVDKAESNSFEAFRVNALGTRNVAQVASEKNCGLLYYSTDYVFDGLKESPYHEWDTPHPINTYGRSKLAGEAYVQYFCARHLIVRTSWLFGPGGFHFVDKILERAQQEEPVHVVDDQRGSPTFSTDLAYMSLCLVEQERRGIYHVTNSGDCTWYELACKIANLKGLKIEIEPINSESLQATASRPRYSVLNNKILKLEKTPLLRPWQNALAGFLGD